MITLNKGYLLTKNKVSSAPRKGVSRFLPFEDVINAPEYAQVLADGIVLVDIDNTEQAETVLKILKHLNINCMAYKTTRGIHALFKLTETIPEKTHCNTALGVEADYKLGINNSYQVIKYNGVEREILIDCNAEELAELPFFLKPVKAPESPLWHMRDGDGRDNVLLSYEFNCWRAGLEITEIKELYKMINEYIFLDKLSPSDIERITRENAFDKVKESCLIRGKQPDTRTISDLMIERDHIVKVNDILHIYTSSGSYIADSQLIEKRMLDYLPALKTAHRKEIFNYLKLNAPERELADKRYVLFKNGIYDIEAQRLLDMSPAYVIPNQIPHNYNENAQGIEMRKALSIWACGNDEIMDLFEEVIGYTLLRENTFRKFFIIVGTKRNGKSKFLSILSSMLGTDNISTVSLEELGERFKNTTLSNKLANLGDDIEDARITRTAILKKLVSGECITVERKGADPEKLYSYATLIFSANQIPAIQDPTGAVRDRMIIIPFNAYFDESDERTDPYIMDKLQSEDNIEYLIQIGLDGLQALLHSKQFTTPKCVADSMERYLMQCDSISAFIVVNRGNILGRINNEVYRDYELFCQEHDIKTVSQNMFSRRIESELNCTSKATNGVRRYIAN